jgi:pyruvate formate lyase activating enzyme
MPRKQHLIAARELVPEQVVAEAWHSGSRSVAYTYAEPTIFFEYAYDTARLARAAGLANIYVTNGYMTGEMLEVFDPYLDGANVDLKAFREKTYHRYVGAGLRPILDNMKTMNQMGIWLEVTTLVIPGINDDPAGLRDAARFVAQELGADTLWHINRFLPAYIKTGRSSTPLSTLYQAREIGLEEGLHFVYIWNTHRKGNNDTRCPVCGELLIRRSGYAVIAKRLESGGCLVCGASIAGVGMAV